MAILESEMNLDVRAELIAISYENLSFSLLATVLIAIILVLGLWDISNTFWLASWFAAMSAMTILRYVNAKLFSKNQFKFSIKE